MVTNYVPQVWLYDNQAAILTYGFSFVFISFFVSADHFPVSVFLSKRTTSSVLIWKQNKIMQLLKNTVGLSKYPHLWSGPGAVFTKACVRNCLREKRYEVHFLKWYSQNYIIVYNPHLRLLTIKTTPTNHNCPQILICPLLAWFKSIIYISLVLLAVWLITNA